MITSYSSCEHVCVFSILVLFFQGFYDADLHQFCTQTCTMEMIDLHTETWLNEVTSVDQRPEGVDTPCLEHFHMYLVCRELL